MTNLHYETIQKSIPAYLKAKGIGLKQLAVMCEVGHTKLKDMLDGKWESINPILWRKVYNVVRPDTINGIYDTADYQAVTNLCNKAIEARFMIGLTGDTGMGKTTALKAFSVRANVHYCYIDATITPKIFLKELMRSMGIFFEGSLYEMLCKVADALNTAEEPLVIVDECAKLSHNMILCLHSLRDRTMRNCGIVLAGMPDFKNKLIRGKTAGVTGYAEFFRRIIMWHELGGLTANEITAILEGSGITDKKEQQEFRRYSRFGDLMNEILLFQTVNN